MNGRELLSRTITTVQEMYLKIGDSPGRISLYYPFEGDMKTIEKEFREASVDSFPDIVFDALPKRIRVSIDEKDCLRISNMPVKETMRVVTELVKDRVGIEVFMERIRSEFQDVRIIKSDNNDFDWIMKFQDELDDDIYCLAEEMGQVTYHRFSREEYASFGYETLG